MKLSGSKYVRYNSWPILLDRGGITLPAGVSVQKVEPYNPSDGDVWIDTSTNTHLTFMYSEDIEAWLPYQQSESFRVQVFTTDGLWVKPAAYRSFSVLVVGGGAGGGGGDASGDGAGGAGGGAGGVYFQTIEASELGASEVVIVGEAGVGSIAKNGLGANGEASSFGDITSSAGIAGATLAGHNGLNANGGGGGNRSYGTAYPSGSGGDGTYLGGAGGVSTDSSNVRPNGEDGESSLSPQTATGRGGGGGGGGANTYGGGGGDAGHGGDGGFPGGGGGGGGASRFASFGNGGNGAPGLVAVVGNTIPGPAGFQGIFVQATPPFNPIDGDIWINTSSPDRHIYTYVSGWVEWVEYSPPS